jgi:hypothetical protein
MTPNSKKEREGLEQEGQQIKGQSTDTTGPVDQVPVRKKRKRLPSLEKMRCELAYQIRESLRASQEKMNNPELTLAERHRWTQIHTYTAQVLNTILRDLQLRDWERRLKVIEEGRLTYKALPLR